MICLYTGNGKGKTSACIGQLIRAHGQGMKCAFGQFLKRDNRAGEQAFLHKFLGNRFYVNGLGFQSKDVPQSEYERTCQEVLRWALRQIPSVQMLILDEFCYALHYGYLSSKDLHDLIGQVRFYNCHLVLTGRYASEELIQEADLVSEITSVKHPHDVNQPPEAGIEY